MHQAIRQFDPDTGQVFHEQQVAAPKWKSSTTSGSEWHRRALLSRRARGHRPASSKGPASLKAMALQICADNVAYIEQNTFRDVPGHLIWDIWENVNLYHETISFRVWKVFVKFLTKGEHRDIKKAPLKLWRFQHKVRKPTDSFDVYINPITSNTFEFITHLTIAGGASFSASELFSLSRLKNIGVLEIIQPQDSQEAAVFPRVTDSIVREWSSQVASGAFPCLRVLRIWGEDFTTHKSLEYVNRFPALSIYDVAGRKEDWPYIDAQHPGWISKIELCDHEEKWADQRLRKTLAQLGGPDGRSDQLFVQDCKSALEKPGQQVAFVPADQVTKTVGALSDQDSLGNYHRRVTVGIWAYVLYSQVGKLWADCDLRDQGVRIEEMASVDQFIIPSLPFASITLGHVPYNKATVTKTVSRLPSSSDEDDDMLTWREWNAKDDSHWTFIRPSLRHPARPVAPTVPIPQKRRSEDKHLPRRPKGRKLQGVDELLSQFATPDVGQSS